jgi:hypothetical protein
MKCYRDLTVWRERIDVVADIYAITKKFPNDERYALCNQFKEPLFRFRPILLKDMLVLHAKSSCIFVYFFRVVGRIGNAPDHCKQTVLRNRRKDSETIGSDEFVRQENQKSAEISR